MRNMESLRFNKYVIDCIEIIETTGEYPSDQYLTQLLRLMHLGSEIHHATPRDSCDSITPFSAPVELVLRTMQAKLLSFHAQLSPISRENRKSPRPYD